MLKPKSDSCSSNAKHSPHALSFNSSNSRKSMKAAKAPAVKSNPNEVNEQLMPAADVKLNELNRAIRDKRRKTMDVIFRDHNKLNTPQVESLDQSQNDNNI